jgi:hypothetical protein
VTMLAAAVRISALSDIPRWRTAIRSIPASGAATCNATGSAVLTVKHCSARIGRGGVAAVLQASSRSGSNAQSAQREWLKHAAVNAAILSLFPVLRSEIP